MVTTASSTTPHHHHTCHGQSIQRAVLSLNYVSHQKILYNSIRVGALEKRLTTCSSGNQKGKIWLLDLSLTNTATKACLSFLLVQKYNLLKGKLKFPGK